jgi:hypothetical protein
MKSSELWRLCGSVIALLATGACGGSPAGPAGPPAKVLTAVTIVSPSAFMFVADQKVLAAVAQYSDGTSESVDAAWTVTAAPSVLNWPGSSGGSPLPPVTAVGNGTGQISAVYQGHVASLTVRVAPDYRGNWTGTFSVVTCARDAGFPLVTFCSSVLASPTQGFQTALTQNQLSAAGTMSLATGSGQVQGTIDEQGNLSLTGTLSASSAGQSYSVTVAGWQSSVVSSAVSSKMSGQFTMVWNLPGALGNGYLASQFQNATPGPQ